MLYSVEINSATPPILVNAPNGNETERQKNDKYEKTLTEQRRYNDKKYSLSKSRTQGF